MGAGACGGPRGGARTGDGGVRVHSSRPDNARAGVSGSGGDAAPLGQQVQSKRTRGEQRMNALSQIMDFKALEREFGESGAMVWTDGSLRSEKKSLEAGRLVIVYDHQRESL